MCLASPAKFKDRIRYIDVMEELLPVSMVSIKHFIFVFYI